MKESIIQKIRSAPHQPGVYIFRDNGGVLYVGKAADLKNRLRSYLKITDAKTGMLHENAKNLNYIVLRSEIESLIEESRLIKELKPKYNVIWSDDKSYHYVAFTREIFPKIFITHKNLKPKTHNLKPVLIGPFTDSSALRTVMKLLRRHFPYCTCFRPHLRDCLNAQIGRCMGFCCKRDTDTHMHTNDTNIKDYKNNIRDIKMILRGQSKKLLKILKDGNEKTALKNILEHREYIGGKKEEFIHSPLHRVECFDLSNLAGKEAVGVMTVLKDGESDKSQWRKFKIKRTFTRDDPRMMAEIVSRRLNHPEWPYPDLMIIDGGITQFRSVRKVIFSKNYNLKTKTCLVSFSKPQKLVYGLKPNDEPTPLAELPTELQRLIEKAIYYTHNFAVRYHRQIRTKHFLGLDFGR